MDTHITHIRDFTVGTCMISEQRKRLTGYRSEDISTVAELCVILQAHLVVLVHSY